MFITQFITLEPTSYCLLTEWNYPKNTDVHRYPGVTQHTLPEDCGNGGSTFTCANLCKFLHHWILMQMFLRFGPHQATVALREKIFKLSTRHPKQLKHSSCHTFLPSFRPTCTDDSHSRNAGGRVDADRCPGVHSQTDTHALSHEQQLMCIHTHKHTHPLILPTTINVNSNPLLTDFLYTWLGRLAKPT